MRRRNLMISVFVGLVVVSPAFFLQANEPFVLSSLPLDVKEKKLLPSDGEEEERFGFSVAFDDNTLVLGAVEDDDNGYRCGSAYVFVRNAVGDWTEQAKLLASDAAEWDWFGYRVALDGDTAVIAAPAKFGSGPGSAYVFVRDAVGDWTEQARLLPRFNNHANFGVSIALDGDTVVIGADRDHYNNGSAYVFVRDAVGDWTEQTRILNPSSPWGQDFGKYVALDGDTAIINSIVFVRDAFGNWTEQARLGHSPGSKLWIELDGQTAVIGVPGSDSGTGSAYVFVRDAFGDWAEQARLFASDGAEQDLFGYSVALGGNTAVISALRDDDNGYEGGSAYVFVRDAFGVWTEQAKLLASDGAEGDFFGASVALDNDTFVIGAIWDDDNGSKSGSAYVFRLLPPTPLGSVPPTIVPAEPR